MKNRILTIAVCAAVLAMTGCGSQSSQSTVAGTAQNAEEAAEQTAEEVTQSSEGITEEPASAAYTAEAAPEEITGELYESEDGWSVRYDSDLIDVEEGEGYVRFTYNGDAAATNRYEFRYIPNTTTDIVLAEATEDYDREELERSEGYFAGQADLWAFNVDVISDGYYSTRGYTAVEHNEGVLLVEKRGSIESDEERGKLISDTMSPILDSFSFSDHEPQEEYDYVPGRYELEWEVEEGTVEKYPAYVVLNVNHTGTLGYSEPVDIIWYSRDSIIREDRTGGDTHYYNIEADAFYLQIGEEWVEYSKDNGMSTGIESISVDNEDIERFRTYENENGWLVYYDKDEFMISESYDAVDFVYLHAVPGTSGAGMLEIRYIDDDTTDEVLADETSEYDITQVIRSEGYVGGGRKAWGFTATIPAAEGNDGATRVLTAVEHNGGTLLFDRTIYKGSDDESGTDNSRTFDEIINTFMFTEHDPEREYDYIPGKYLLNDRALQRDASNYPTYVRLYEDHTGILGGPDEKSIIWYSRDGIITESSEDGASYFYNIEDDTLYLHMGEEWVEYNKEYKDD